MIVPMKKMMLLCLAADQDRTLTALREIGVVHLKAVQSLESDDLGRVRDALDETQHALDILLVHRESRKGAQHEQSPLQADVSGTIQRVRELALRRKSLLDRLDTLAAERASAAPFGGFNPADIKELETRGIRLRFFFVPRSEPLTPPGDATITVLQRTPEGTVVAVTSLEPLDWPAAQSLPIPPRNVNDVDREIAQADTESAQVLNQLNANTVAIPALQAEAERLKAELAYLEAKAGMGAVGDVAYLSGYCPEDALPVLRKAAAEHGWGLRFDDPGPEDPVPTLLRNPPWIEPIKVIFRMIGIVPGYHELDISGVFLLFYSVFFAMLVSDAGYGLLFLALTLAIRAFARKAPPELPRLLGILSVCTIIWGVLAGSYFGIPFDLLPSPLRGARIHWLAQEANLMSLCFLIGSIHLTVAHAWNAWRWRKQSGALAQLGWIAITWTMYYMAHNMILGRSLPPFVGWLFLGGVAAVVLFMTPVRALKSEWPSHIMLPLNIIGNFGDVVSYVRLFAVGSAGTAISMAFNEMAVGSGIRSVGAGLSAALILFLAHALNILLCGLGVIVHGVRLNTLEFSGHLGMQWSGVNYEPFRRPQCLTETNRAQAE